MHFFTAATVYVAQIRRKCISLCVFFPLVLPDVFIHVIFPSNLTPAATKLVRHFYSASNLLFTTQKTIYTT